MKRLAKKLVVFGVLAGLSMMGCNKDNAKEKEKEKESLKEKQLEACRAAVTVNAKKLAHAIGDGDRSIINGTQVMGFKVMHYKEVGDLQGHLVEAYIDFNGLNHFHARFGCFFDKGTTKGETELISYKSKNGVWKTANSK